MKVFFQPWERKRSRASANCAISSSGLYWNGPYGSDLDFYRLQIINFSGFVDLTDVFWKLKSEFQDTIKILFPFLIEFQN